MKLIVTGANGQLGSELKRLSGLHREHHFVFTDLPDLDLTNASEVKSLVSSEQADILINAAAYTAVDKAESDSETAFKVNRDSVGHLASACEESGTLMIHVSTDYVFDGKGHRPYKENDACAPVSAYGISKLEGERELLRVAKRSVILRTSWLYSAYGHNFVKTMLRLGKERGEVSVVNDQIGSPTNARDLAQAIMDMLPKCSGLGTNECFHFTNSGVASWYDFALAIFELAGIPCVVTPIPTEAYPTPAQRPFYSVMDNAKIRSYFDLHILPWRESLKDCLLELSTGDKS